MGKIAGKWLETTGPGQSVKAAVQSRTFNIAKKCTTGTRKAKAAAQGKAFNIPGTVLVRAHDANATTQNKAFNIRPRVRV